MHIDMEPMHSPEHDDEGRMAKADLYKLANYSLKLFKQLDNSQQLEGWVQAKITKAADYIASVYHYMEYEMKFSEYGKSIEDSDVYTEGQKRELKNKLLEAKEKVKELKKAQAEKMKKKDEKVEEASGFRATDKKKGKVEKSEKKQYFVKLEKEGKTKGVTMVADEGETEGDVRDRAKRENQGWSVASVRAKDTGSGEEVSEGKGDGNLANNAKPYDKITRGDVIAGRLGKDEKGGKEKKVKETAVSGAPQKSGIPATAKTTVPGMRATQQDLKNVNAGAALGEVGYSAKKAAAGKDIGKPGKQFAKIAAKAEKGGAKSGAAVAGAVLKKLRAKG